MDGQLNLFDLQPADQKRKPCEYSFNRELGQRVRFTQSGTLDGMTGTIITVEPYYTKVMTEWGVRVGTPTTITPAPEEEDEQETGKESL